jgi:hypothetical protein
VGNSLALERGLEGHRREPVAFFVGDDQAGSRDKQWSCARPFGFAQGKLAEGGCPHMAVPRVLQVDSHIFLRRRKS